MIKKLIDIAIEAGNEIIKIYNSADFGVEIKSDNSPLTLADKAANKVIVAGLQQFNFPILSEEGAEIPYSERKIWSKFWLIDPLDGTKEFIKKNDEFTVNIALIENSKPILGIVYAPVLRELFIGSIQDGAFKYTLEKDSDAVLNKKAIKVAKPTDNLIIVASRSHLNDDTLNFVETLKKDYKSTEFISKGSSLKLCLVAEGRAHIYPRYAPTMEWDTAAGHAVVLAAGGKVEKSTGGNLEYNKENLLNPYFIVKHD